MMVISSRLIIALMLFFDLSQIAAIGSISILFVHGVTHVGHLRKLSETGASAPIVLAAAATSFVAMGLAIAYVVQTSQGILFVLTGFGVLAFALEFALRRLVGREIRPRSTEAPTAG